LPIPGFIGRRALEVHPDPFQVRRLRRCEYPRFDEEPELDQIRHLRTFDQLFEDPAETVTISFELGRNLMDRIKAALDPTTPWLTLGKPSNKRIAGQIIDPPDPNHPKAEEKLDIGTDR
jgi:hypothetical protein